MTISRFIKELIIVITLSLSAITITNYFLGDNAEWRLSFIAIALFSSLSTFINVFGSLILKSENKYSFIRLVMVNVMIKVLASIATVWIYFKLYTPDNKFFLLPFLLVYLIFTIFETSFLIRQSDANK